MKKIILFLLFFFTTLNLFSYSLEDIFWMDEMFISTPLVTRYFILPLDTSKNIRIDQIVYEKDKDNNIQLFEDIDYDESIIPKETMIYYYKNNELIAFGGERSKYIIQKDKNIRNIIKNNEIKYSYIFNYINSDTLSIEYQENEKITDYKTIKKINNSFEINDYKSIYKITFANNITIEFKYSTYIFNNDGIFLKKYYKDTILDQLITKNNNYYIYNSGYPDNLKFIQLDLIFDENHNLIFKCDDAEKTFIFTNYSILPCDDEGNILKTVDELKTDYFIEGLEYKEPEKEIVLEKPKIPTEEVSLEKNNKLQFNYIYIILLSILILTFIIIIVLIIRRRKNGRN